MNKINKAFDSIKASEELKKKTYQMIDKRMRKNYTIRNLFVTFSVAFTSILLVVLTTQYNNNHPRDNDNVKIMINQEQTKDQLFYHGYIYSVDKASIDSQMLDQKLGIIHMVDLERRNLNKDFESYAHDQASLYTIKGVDNNLKLAVLDGNQIYLYVKVSK